MRFYELNSGKITIGCQDISKMKWSDLRSMFGMDRLMQGRTAFVIAHCLSTIRDADSIIVLKDGDIVEVGNHDSFMAKKAFTPIFTSYSLNMVKNKKKANHFGYIKSHQA